MNGATEIAAKNNTTICNTVWRSWPPIAPGRRLACIRGWFRSSVCIFFIDLTSLMLVGPLGAQQLQLNHADHKDHHKLQQRGSSCYTKAKVCEASLDDQHVIDERRG